jgi:hypothetical protein
VWSDCAGAKGARFCLGYPPPPSPCPKGGRGVRAGSAKRVVARMADREGSNLIVDGRAATSGGASFCPSPHAGGMAPP